MATDKQIPGILSEPGLLSGRMCETLMILTPAAMATSFVSLQVSAGFHLLLLLFISNKV